MYGLDTAHRQCANTSEDKFQDQFMFIRLMQTNRSAINDANIKTINYKEQYLIHNKSVEIIITNKVCTVV